MKIDISKTVHELIVTLSYVIDIDQSQNMHHSWRVSILAARLSRKHVSPKRLKNIFYAGLLHDIGGMGLPLNIIHYLERNDKTAQNVLLSHPIVGAQFVSEIPQMSDAAKLVLDHHEWIDGKGYPRAKTKDNIPWGSQVIRLADAIDIALQTKAPREYGELKGTLSQNINKEYSQELFDEAFSLLEKDDFFNKLSETNNLSGIFEETKKDVGIIRVNKKIDAIGTTLEVIAEVADMKHPYTSGHSLRVSRYAMSIALAMKLAHDDITRIKWAGLIHDIGKVSVPRNILDKPGSLTPEEFQEVKKHVVHTAEIMKLLPSLTDILPMAACHHEYFDGSGYPAGLKADEIPFGARILTVCDAFDAMVSNRPYRNPLTPEEACNEIKRLSGKQFDPQIVEEALPLFRSLGL